ncbi:EboA domain-containing protein [Parafrankia elaeagni]|uniref:EboA domain-containing protein n=1 Tax=Parafrankia elaeagni TaxID=222534 RepID=UPI000373D22B|nr:EboA domain-containing protein [Parafrankia elaeagni]
MEIELDQLHPVDQPDVGQPDGLDDLCRVLAPRLDPHATRWLAAATAAVAADPDTLTSLFPQAGRWCGRKPLTPGRAGQRGVPDTPTSDTPTSDTPVPRTDLDGWQVQDAARTVLLAALPTATEPRVAAVTRIYQRGDAAEKRGVLRALPLLNLGDAALVITRDALRTNDSRLVAAALGPYAARHLDDQAWRHGVLKCVFLEVDLTVVADLERRADAELGRMLGDLAAERAAAGRRLPADAQVLLGRLANARPLW